MTEQLNPYFEKIQCITVDHKTPFDTIQNFVFCSFKKLGAIYKIEIAGNISGNYQINTP